MVTIDDLNSELRYVSEYPVLNKHQQRMSIAASNIMRWLEERGYSSRTSKHVDIQDVELVVCRLESLYQYLLNNDVMPKLSGTEFPYYYRCNTYNSGIRDPRISLASNGWSLFETGSFGSRYPNAGARGSKAMNMDMNDFLAALNYIIEISQIDSFYKSSVIPATGILRWFRLRGYSTMDSYCVYFGNRNFLQDNLNSLYQYITVNDFLPEPNYEYFPFYTTLPSNIL